MRPHQLLVSLSLTLLGITTVAADLERDDIPNSCWDTCRDLVETSRRCDRNTHNDRDELQCICNWDQASSQIPLCEACIAQYRRDHSEDDDDHDDPHDNDAYDILTDCSLSTTSYTATATATATGQTTQTGTGSSPTSTAADNTNVIDNAAPASSAPISASLAVLMGLGFGFVAAL